MPEKIIVTGGSGFIGSHTVVELVESGFEPIIIDNFSASQRFIIDRIKEICGREITFYEADCRDEKKMNEIFGIEKPTGVIHFAAFKSVNESIQHPELYFDNNINSLLVTMRVMAKNSVNHLIFSSSCTVYGEPLEIPVTENTPLNKAASPYGETKVIGEEKIKTFVSEHRDFQTIILRYFNPIGAHPSGLIGELPIGIPNNLVPFITQTAAGWREKITVNGNDYSTPDGTCIRDYIHVMDLAKAHVSALQRIKNHSISAPEVFNLGTGKGVSILEAIHAFEKANGIQLKYEYGIRRKGDIEKIYASVKKANEQLQWKCIYTVEDAMKHAWTWQQTLKKPE